MKTKKFMSVALISFSLVPAFVICIFFAVAIGIKDEKQSRELIASQGRLETQNVKDFFDDSFNMLYTINDVLNAKNLVYDYDKLTHIGQGRSKEAKNIDRNIINNIMLQNKAVKRVSIVNANNMVVASSNQRIENRKALLENKYVEVVKQNKTVVSRVFSDIYENGEKCFIVAIPLIDENNEYLGFVMASIDLEYTTKNVIHTKFFETGTIIVFDDGNNPVIAEENLITPVTIRTMFNKIMRLGEQAGTFSLKQGRNDYIIKFEQMPKTGWTVACFANKADFRQPLGVIVFYLLSIGIIFFLVVLLFSMLIEKWFTTPLEKLVICLHHMDKGDYETRIPYLGKNEFSEIGNAFNKLMTRIAQDNKELAIKEERYRIANEQSNSIIFEYNVEQGGVTCSANACEFAEYPAFTDNFPDSLETLEIIHKDDTNEFSRLFASMSQGKRRGNMEIRMRIYKGDYHWFNLTLTTIADSKTFKPLRIVGKLTDIDEEKRLTENLTFKAERDPLTGIYNKLATQTGISQRISERKHDLYYAFIVMDIDCFKSVNDNYGHQKGDQVLVDVAKAIMSQIRDNDIAGRVGGDEFMVMLSEMPSKEAIAKKVESVLDAVRQIALDEEANKYVTSSIGVAICPKDGATFSQLYANADAALYECKKMGKNGYKFFDDIPE